MLPLPESFVLNRERAVHCVECDSEGTIGSLLKIGDSFTGNDLSDTNEWNWKPHHSGWLWVSVPTNCG